MKDWDPPVSRKMRTGIRSRPRRSMTRIHQTKKAENMDQEQQGNKAKGEFLLRQNPEG